MAPSQTSVQRSLLALAVAAALGTLAACGGGADAPAEGAVQFAAQMRAQALQAPAAAPLSASATTATATTTAAGAALIASVTADMVLDWAEFKFASLFPRLVVQKFPAVVYAGVTYNARAYSGPWGTRYLGITPDGRIFGLGDFTNNLLQAFDTVAFWSTQVDADRCGVNPSSCTATPPAGPLNDCTMPAAQALVTGNRFLATYAVTGSTTGQFTIDSLVQGAGTFEGQSAIKLLTKFETAITAEGVTITSKNDSVNYEQDGGNGFTRSLGAEASITAGGVTLPGVGSVGGSVSSVKSVFSPPESNVEFSIQPGQTIKKNSSILSTVDGRVLPLVSTTTTYSFVLREQITNANGRSYSTCRYTTTDVTGGSTSTHWHILNRGAAARTSTVTTVNGKTTTELIELVQGSFNGAPL